MFEGIEKNIELAKKSWESVKHLHLPIREHQNKFISQIIEKPVDLKPAEVSFGWWSHLLRRDYLMILDGKTDTVVIDSCAVRDYNQNVDNAITLGLNLSDYLLARVACSEGTRTLHHVSAEYGVLNSLKHEEPLALSYLGNWLGNVSLKHIGSKTLPLEKAVLDTIAESNLKKLVLRPRYAFFRIDEKMHPEDYFIKEDGQKA